MRFQLLGPLAVSGDDGPIAIGGPKQRLVLAHLLLRVNQTVTAARLIDAVWGEEPPETARGTLQSYVSRLRNTLGSGRIQGKAPGYLFRAEPEELDAFQFESLLGEARDDGLEPKAALDALDEALALWRGPALADLAFEPSLLGEIARLEELRLAATEERIGVLLDLGQHAEVIPELETATVAHPLRERLWAQLVLAMYRSGRQAEALAAFDHARELLADELGIDPSRELQDLHERVLRQDESLQLPGEPLRGYRLLDKVGEGAFGSVYRAIQPQIEREVAIKSIHAELANQPDFVRRFEREAQLVARLEHPHIVPLYDYWREPDAAYLIMRFLRGGSLEDVLQDGALELGRAAKIVDQIGAALAAAHHQGVVHRDVKPGNVLLDEEGSAYLSDFGIALETGEPEQTAGTMIRGTPAYLSPEQIRLEQTSPRSDIYALGVVLYEMLTGEHPFPGTSLNVLLDQHLNRPIPSVRQARPEVPPAVDAAIARATAKEPQARFGDVLELCAAFRGAIEGTAARVIAPGEIRNPYKGLRAFFEADSADFFGREVLTRRLVERLAEYGAARFLCVVGPSGSGKSSAVRAGLIPAIRRGAIRGSDRWYVADLLPGGHPMRELERALLGVSVDPPPSLLDDLERDELGLARAVDRLLPDPDAELLIVLDQLEELFTMVENDAERAHVLESFRVAAEDPASRIRVIATLRADFYDQPLSVRGFGDLLAARNEAITPMSPEDLERAIVGPAERVGLDVEPGLVAAMVADVIDRPGALPLLQYALTELADREDVGSLTLNAYRRIGGVSGALARRAERLHDALDDPGREACRQLFLRLVTLGEASDESRRRVRRSELTSFDPDATDPVIDAFGRHRLLSFDRDPTSREPTVEIAHEALLGVWTRLRGWIDEAREDVRQERALGSGAAEWRASDRDPSFLLQGNRLLQTEAWAAGTDLAMASAHREFLDASIERRDAERTMEDRRRERERYLERRSRSRLRILVAVLSAAALVASALTVIAVGERRVASEQSRVALARELAAASVATLNVDAERSILLALEAIETQSHDGTVLRAAEEALHRAVGASRIVRSLPGEGDILDWSPDGSLFVTEGEEETGLVDIRDARTGESVVPPFRGHDSDVNGVVFSADGLMLATTGDDGDVRVWDTSTGEELWGFDGPTGIVWVPSFSPDGSLLAAPFEDEDVVRIWDLATGRLVREIEHGDIGFATSFSPDGQRMAFATWDSGAIVVDVRSGEQVLHLPHGGQVNDVGWSPDGSRIVTSGWDGTVRIWEAESGDPRGSLYGHRSEIVASDWSPDSSRLVTGSTDGTARIWEIHPDGGNELLSLPAQAKSTWVWPTFSADGTRVMTGAGPTGAVRVWDVSLSGDAEWANVPTSTAPGVAFTSDGTGVIASNGDGSATVWDAGSGQGVRVIGRRGGDFGPVAEPDHWSPLIAMAVSTDGLVAASGKEGVTVWEESTGNERFVLPVPAIRGWYPDLAWSGDGTVLAATRSDGVTVLVDQAGEEVAAIREEKGYYANALGLSPDGRLLATSRESAARPNTETARVTIWDWRQGKIILTIPGWALDVDFDPSGHRVAIGSLFGPGEIWDVSSGRKLASLSGHTGSIQSIRFSPDGSVVATAGKDGTVRLWDPASGTQLLLLDGHQAEVFALAFSPDGSKLASSSWDRTVRVWALDLNDLIQIARAELTRGFTDAECRQYLHVDACPQA